MTERPGVEGWTLRRYEAMLIFPGSLDETALNGALEHVGKEIERQQGRVRDARSLGKRNFARPMRKKNYGYYAIMDFELPPGRVDALLGRLKLNETVFRVQITQAGSSASAGGAAEAVAAPDAPAGEDGPGAGDSRGETGVAAASPQGEK